MQKIPVNGGITPACAGKTRNKSIFNYTGRDHPRVCGENKSITAIALKRPGSPPRVRGKPFVCAPRLRRCGITPACAGKTWRDRNFDSWRGDHPRVCGENRNLNETLTEALGSPPRVRGKPEPIKTIDTSNRDHPRVCGENPPFLLSTQNARGSPPRVRGKHAHTRRAGKRHGITPACAGKTFRAD